MAWKHSGALAKAHHPDWAKYDLSSGQPEAGQPITLSGQPYLVISGYLVPCFKPSGSEAERHHIRERLNMELCDRVFRISDARDVSRDPQAADEAISVLMQAYESTKEDEHRGIGRVLFGRIVSRIRTLSKHYLELHRDHDNHSVSQDEINILRQIHDLYQYVMVEHRDMFGCVRLFDLSEDEDGIIEEVFSEIGKTQQMPIEAIYTSRVRKIGAAMHSMTEVASIMRLVAQSVLDVSESPICEAIEAYDEVARQLVGIPSSEHLAYDRVACHYVDAHDVVRLAVSETEQAARPRLDAHLIEDWLFDGVQLIHSMQNLRDSRPNSIAAYVAGAKLWLKPDAISGAA